MHKLKDLNQKLEKSKVLNAPGGEMLVYGVLSIIICIFIFLSGIFFGR